MNVREAQALGQQISSLLQNDQLPQAFSILAPILAERTPFAMLRRLGAEIGNISTPILDEFLERTSRDKTEGGWVIISGILAARLEQDLSGSLARCRSFIVEADIWYAADTLGEWVVGQALVSYFQPVLSITAHWREDANPWVRRAVGTSAHYWAKRSRGSKEFAAQVNLLLSFLEPLFEERAMEAVKGVGWGLKTLGKYYPDLLARWLRRQVVELERPHRALMLRKALTYLNEEQRALATSKVIR